MGYIARFCTAGALALLTGVSAHAADREVFLWGTGPVYNSPVIAEIDGNKANGQEIAVTGADGTVEVVTSQGVVLWTAYLPSYGCGASGNINSSFSSPAVGALTPGSKPAVVVGYGGFSNPQCGGGVVAFRGSDGKQLWHFDTKKFAAQKKFFAVNHTVFGAPSLYDLNGDGSREVIFGSFDRNVYVLTARGQFQGYYHTADTVFSSPSIADADGDGSPEIVIGTDISRNDVIKPPTPDGGYLKALRASVLSGQRAVGFRQSGSAVWQAEFSQVVQSPPVIAELVSSNRGREVVVASGCYFPENSANKRGRYVKVLSLATGKELRSLTIPTCTTAEPAVADVDGDGRNDVVIPLHGMGALGGDGYSRVIAWNPDRRKTLWTTLPMVGGAYSDEVGYFNGLVVADLDKNGSREVLVNSGTGLAILSGETGEHLSCPFRSCSDGRKRFSGFSFLKSAPAVGDLDGDGTLEVVVAGPSRWGGTLKIFSGFEQAIESAPGRSTNYLPWPMFRGGATHRAYQAGR